MDERLRDYICLDLRRHVRVLIKRCDRRNLLGEGVFDSGESWGQIWPLRLEQFRLFKIFIHHIW